jgi:hypothetical protein
MVSALHLHTERTVDVCMRLYIGVDICIVLVLFSIECDIKPSAASGVVPAGLNHSMHHFPQRCTCISTWLERRSFKLVFCSAVIHPRCSKGLDQKKLKFIAIAFVVPF